MSSDSENWKLKQPPELSAALTSAKSSPGKSGGKARNSSTIELNIVELTYSGLIAECPKDTVQQGEDFRLRIVVTDVDSAEAGRGSETLEMSAKAARLSLGAGQENDVVELQFVEWDRKRWDELKTARSSLQSQVGRIFQALKH